MRWYPSYPMAFGRCCARGCGRTVASLRRSYPTISPSSSSSITPDAEEKLCSAPSWRLCYPPPQNPDRAYYITQADYEFWTDETKVPAQFKAFLDTARKNLSPNRERIKFIKDGEEFLPGIHAILAPGHTVGHTIFMINSGNSSLCYIADLAHHPILLLEKPLTEFMYDTDPKQSAQSRVKMLSMLAANRTLILGYHFAWPGIGHIAKQGEGFRYYPAGMKMEL
jgi:glyoxylase-like metal-dependent hydrolase (beta-lactamase superfamily II)